MSDLINEIAKKPLQSQSGKQYMILTKATLFLVFFQFCNLLLNAVVHHAHWLEIIYIRVGAMVLLTLVLGQFLKRGKDSHTYEWGVLIIAISTVSLLANSMVCMKCRHLQIIEFVVLLFSVGLVNNWGPKRVFIANSIISLSFFLLEWFVLSADQKSDLWITILGAHGFVTLLLVYAFWTNPHAATHQYLDAQVEKMFKLTQQNETLKESLDANHLFLRILNDDFRTPLTIIDGVNQTLSSMKDQAEDIKCKETLSVMSSLIKSSSLKMLSSSDVLSDLMSLKDAENQSQSSPVDLQEFFKQLESDLKPFEEVSRLKVCFQNNLSDQTAVLMDHVRVERILVNLIIFANRVGAGKTELRVNLENVGGLLVFSLKFDKPHVNTTLIQQQLREEFLDSNGQQHMHLLIAKMLTRFTGGEIQFHSENGSHHLIYKQNVEPTLLAIPDQSQESLESDQTHREALYSNLEELITDASEENSIELPFKKPVILFVDTRPSQFDYLNDLLKADYHLIYAKSGEDAMLAAQKHMPAAILLDESLPDITVIEWCRNYHEKNQSALVPIVILSTSYDETFLQHCLEVGAYDVLRKPYTSTRIKLRLRRTVAGVTFRRDLRAKSIELAQALEQIKRQELELVVNEKLMSLGQLSSSVIHEINNPINYMKGAAHLLKRFDNKLSSEDAAEFRDLRTDLSEGINRITSIIHNLKGFTKNSKLKTQRVYVQNSLTTALKEIEVTYPVLPVLDVSIPAGFFVYFGETQLYQVLFNIINNSTQAIASRFEDLSEGRIEVKAYQEGDHPVITVRDNGCGMSEETLGQVFNPLFTTKSSGKGMGVGMSLVKKILDFYSTEVKYASEINHFTEITLIFKNKNPDA